MRVALCLHGLTGTNAKYGAGASHLDPNIAYSHFKKHLLELDQDVDVFFHTWSQDKIEALVNLYNPVSYVSEKQPHFSDDSRTQAIFCRWASAQRSVQLMTDSEREYDFVLLTRFDIAFLVDFRFKDFDSDRFYAQSPPGPMSNGIQLINDLWFFSSKPRMERFTQLFDHLHERGYQNHLGSNHELARKHLINIGFNDTISYVFKRDWCPPGETTNTPLVRWKYK